jgi:hypothetical protein
MFRTHRLSKDIDDINFLILTRFGLAAKTIMRFLISNRTYNIQLLGSTGVTRRLLRNTLTPNYIHTFTPNHTAGGDIQHSIAFPTSLGKIIFNIRECRYGIDDANLDGLVRNEWIKTDAFFVITSHEDEFKYKESERWIQTIRRVRGDDVPIVLVDIQLQCDRRGRCNLQPNIQHIQNLCARYGNIPYVHLASASATNIHGLFLVLQDILRTSDRNLGEDNPNIPITPLIIPPPPPQPPPQPPTQPPSTLTRAGRSNSGKLQREADLAERASQDVVNPSFTSLSGISEDERNYLKFLEKEIEELNERLNRPMSSKQAHNLASLREYRKYLVDKARALRMVHQSVTVSNLKSEICYPSSDYTERINKELLYMKKQGWDVLNSKCGMTVTFNVNDVSYTVDLKFKPNYPNTPVGIVLTKPFTYVFPPVHVDSQTGEWLIDDIFTLTTDLLKRRAEMQVRLPIITEKAYLVLGANPDEPPRGRSHYENTNVFFIDNQDIIHDRFIQVDFSSPVEMGILSSLLPNKFDEICFDDSTFKFFSGDGKYETYNTPRNDLLKGSMLYERICYLTNMLKDTGTLFIERYSELSGPAPTLKLNQQRMDMILEKNREKIVDYCRRAGLNVNFKTVRKIGSTSKLVPVLYKKVLVRKSLTDVVESDGSERELLVGSKTATLG